MEILYLEIQQNTSRLFYQDDEIVVVAEPVIQTVFNVPFEKSTRDRARK
jgi:hypothetical protein